MSRYGKTVNLISVETTVDNDGSPIQRTKKTTVFANTFTVGTLSWVSAMAAGLNPDAEVQVRSLEYKGQEICELDGIQYDVERAAVNGEFTRLTLKRRQRNAR